jgi:hypothetical protein
MSYRFLPSPSILLAVIYVLLLSRSGQADEFDQFLKPLLVEKCIKCHGEKQVKGEVNFKAITAVDQLLASPELIQQVIEAVDSNAMPPDDEPQLDESVRLKLLQSLRTLLKRATDGVTTKLQPRRLNRFHYNNAIRDLFRLNKDIFLLSEKLMARHVNYLHAGNDVMPDVVQVSCHSLMTSDGFENVQPYPKDLRAAHGFDNQANQLTLSPLLLDAYLRLSVSIVESPDFNPQNVGIWESFFEAPANGGDLEEEVRRRIGSFMQRAFRTTVEPDALDRYTEYTLAKSEQGLSFTDSMKKFASAILCSPLFLYRYEALTPADASYELASRLSFFLWGSIPDEQLLALAGSGELSKPEILASTIDRMLTDPKIERFLDSFPAQWMQLENLFGVAPDPAIYPKYSLPGGLPASVQMALEPLLLFDAVFIEDRPVIDLIKPTFAYQSDFLKTWYSGRLTPSDEFRHEVAEELRIREETRDRLTKEIADVNAKHIALTTLIRERLLTAKRKSLRDKPKEIVDLKPYAAWEFDGDLKASVSSLHLTAHGDVSFEKGGVHLDRAYLESPKLPIDLKSKTLEVWCSLKTIKQRGGGVMTIQGRGGFDSIVYGERKAMHWISGSNGHVRTQDFFGSTPEEEAGELLQLVMVYDEDGTTALYRNGRPYGAPYNKGAMMFAKGQSSVLFGLRHLPTGGNRNLAVSIDRARLYDRTLSPDEVAASSSATNIWISESELDAGMTAEEKVEATAFTQAHEKAERELRILPRRNPKQKIDVNQEVQNRFNNKLISQVRSRVFKRVPVEDPRYGGIITTAATMTMTSAPKRTLPIARGAWMIEVIFNDPPPPPPNDIPPLNEESGPENLTIREKFAKHRENPDCAGCHARLDPLGFALENFDITGRWRDKYENKRDVDASGTLLKKYDFTDIVEFKKALVKEDQRFAKAFTAHLLRFALARELTPADTLVVDEIVARAEPERFKLKSLIREVILSDEFLKQ